MAMETTYTAWSRLAQGILLAVLVANVYRAAVRPISLSEAAEYERAVRPHLIQVLADFDARADLVYALAAKRTVGLFRVSPFSVRLPDLIAGAFFLWAVFRITRQAAGKWACLLAAALALNPLVLWHFSEAGGYGVALALLAWAVVWRERAIAALLVGLAVAADVAFAPAAVVVLLAGKWKNSWNRWMERLVVPAVVTAFLLLAIPLSRVQAFDLRRAPRDDARDAQVWREFQDLRARAGNRTARIGTGPALVPYLNFYRDEYRLRNWARIGSGPPERFDYYVPAGRRR